ncbi:MAG: hypothetical protein ACYDA1_01930 [Vulcanimicrobiaceae bacterium]
MFSRFLCAFLAASLFQITAASARPLVVATTTQQLVLTHNGSVHLQGMPPGGVRPGEIIRYTYIYTNKGDTAALALLPVGHMSDRVIYLLGSASPGSPEFSLDGQHWSARPMVAVRDAHGHLSYKPASPALYRALRWHVAQPLRPGATLRFSYEVRVK